MKKRLLSYIDFLAFVPLVVFLATVQFHAAKFPDRWAYAYFYAFAPALAFSIGALADFPRCTKLWLGTNLWFALLGFLTVMRAWSPLEFLGNTFQESGGFVATAVVGVVACIAAPGAFVGATRSARSARYAWLLAGVAASVAALSYMTQGTRVLSITVPVVTFVGVNFVLRRRLQSASEA